MPAPDRGRGIAARSRTGASPEYPLDGASGRQDIPVGGRVLAGSRPTAAIAAARAARCGPHSVPSGSIGRSARGRGGCSRSALHGGATCAGESTCGGSRESGRFIGGSLPWRQCNRTSLQLAGGAYGRIYVAGGAGPHSRPLGTAARLPGPGSGPGPLRPPRTSRRVGGGKVQDSGRGGGRGREGSAGVRAVWHGQAREGRQWSQGWNRGPGPAKVPVRVAVRRARAQVGGGAAAARGRGKALRCRRPYKFQLRLRGRGRRPDAQPAREREGTAGGAREPGGVIRWRWGAGGQGGGWRAAKASRPSLCAACGGGRGQCRRGMQRSAKLAAAQCAAGATEERGAVQAGRSPKSVKQVNKSPLANWSIS